MKLQSKSAVNSQVAEEKRKQISEGVKIAQKVDILRETLSDEEINFQNRKENMIATLKAEIDPLAREKQQLLEELPNLREQKCKLLEPVDLTEARSKVRQEEKELKEREDSLVIREVKVSSQEKDLNDYNSELTLREKKIKVKEEENNQNLLESEEKLLELTQITNDIERYKVDVEKEISQRYEIIQGKERDYEIKKREIDIKENQNKKKERFLLDRERQINSRYQIMLKAQEYVKRTN